MVSLTWTLLMMPALGPPDREWLLLLQQAAFNLLTSLFLTFQGVHACSTLPSVKSTDCPNQWPH